MERQHGTKPKNSKNNLLLKKMLPRAFSAVAFGKNSPSYSPGRDHHHHNNRSFFSGPIVSIVPVEARVRRQKNDDVLEEPTSPKVSCIGQIKLAKKCPIGSRVKTASSGSKEKETMPFGDKATDRTKSSGHVSKIKRMFSAKSRTVRKPETIAADALTADKAAPQLGQMRRFASGREAFSSFDWTAEISPEELDDRHRRDYHSDEEREHVYGEDEERIVPFSAPILLDGGERLGLKPKKEVCLWKRRTMDPPKPLQIKGS